MWHKLDAENVLRVTRRHRRRQLELLVGALRLIRVHIEMLIVASRCEKGAGAGPRESVDTSGMPIQLVDDIEVRDQRAGAVYGPVK